MYDLINSFFQLGGSLAAGLTIRVLLKDKMVRGAHWGTVAYFLSWGLWNLFYFPSVSHPLSTYASVALVLTNGWRLWLMVYYVRQEKLACQKD